MTQTNIINKLDELSYKGFKEAYLHQLEDTCLSLTQLYSCQTEHHHYW